MAPVRRAMRRALPDMPGQRQRAAFVTKDRRLATTARFLSFASVGLVAASALFILVGPSLRRQAARHPQVPILERAYSARRHGAVSSLLAGFCCASAVAYDVWQSEPWRLGGIAFIVCSIPSTAIGGYRLWGRSFFA